MRKLLSVLVVVFTLSTVFATSAKATTFTQGSGTFEITSQTNTLVGQFNGYTFFIGTRQGEIWGTITGSYTENIAFAIDALGNVTFTGTDTCTCIVAGRSGTVTSVFKGTGVYQPPVNTSQGQFTIVSETGGLADLHGDGTFQRSGNYGTYTVEYYFGS